MGIWGSAFCATLAHYYKEIRPVVKGLAGFGSIDGLIEERNDDLAKLHPVDPGVCEFLSYSNSNCKTTLGVHKVRRPLSHASSTSCWRNADSDTKAIPNYALGLKDQLPPSCPTSVFNHDYLQLMDAGMSNNLPVYPLLRRGRDVDIIVCFDASADIKQENWLSAVDGYAKQRSIKGWPFGAGWPKAKGDPQEALKAAEAVTAQQAAIETAEARERRRISQHIDEVKTSESISPKHDGNDLGYCNVWVGTTRDRRSESEPLPSRQVQHDTEWKLLEPDAGITVVYFPLLPNPKVEGVNPDTSPFLSTWNFIYSPEEIDKVVALAKANFDAGRDQTRRTVRAVYERKKAKRLALEGDERTRRWKKRLRERGDQFQ